MLGIRVSCTRSHCFHIVDMFLSGTLTQNVPSCHISYNVCDSSLSAIPSISLSLIFSDSFCPTLHPRDMSCRSLIYTSADSKWHHRLYFVLSWRPIFLVAKFWSSFTLHDHGVIVCWIFVSYVNVRKRL